MVDSTPAPSAQIIGYADVAALANVERSPRLDERDRACVRGLLRAWSEHEGLTFKQWQMASALARKGGTQPQHGGRYVLTKAPDGRWWLDTSSHRQACRGRKSGLGRRYRTRERDERIGRWINTGKYSVLQVAVHCGLHPTTVWRIASRARGGSGFWRGPERQWPVLRPHAQLREPYMRAPSARPPVTGPRNLVLFNALIRWCGLKTVRRLPDEAVKAEAERLNAGCDPPLPARRVQSVVRSVLRYRRSW